MHYYTSISTSLVQFTCFMLVRHYYAIITHYYTSISTSLVQFTCFILVRHYYAIITLLGRHYYVISN